MKLGIFLSVVQVALAATVTTKHPTVQPGPGLPSLEELGLTSEWLYSQPPPEKPPFDTSSDSSKLSKRYTNVCSSSPRAADADALACYYYLDALGTVNCEVIGEGATTTFCTSGTATITGDNISGQVSASSYCSDVASAVSWVWAYCSDSSDTTAGSAAAAGNGGLVVFTL